MHDVIISSVQLIMVMAVYGRTSGSDVKALLGRSWHALHVTVLAVVHSALNFISEVNINPCFTVPQPENLGPFSRTTCTDSCSIAQLGFFAGRYSDLVMFSARRAGPIITRPPLQL